VGGACAVFAVGKNLKEMCGKKTSFMLLFGVDFTIGLFDCNMANYAAHS